MSPVELDFNVDWMLAPSERLGFVCMMTEWSIAYITMRILRCPELWIFSIYDKSEALKKKQTLTILFLCYFLERGSLWAA